jgi:protein-S-isoprenylcysteine O-methyltransferase Ste14
MYIGAVGIVVGEAVFFRSVTLCAYAAVLAFAFHLFVVGYEEPGLRTRFGDSYETYRARVPRWWPRRPVE